MIITLTHPEHGTHFAYDENEAAACVSRGWRRVAVMTPNVAVNDIAPEPVAEVAVIEQVAPKPKPRSKYGRDVTI